MAKELVGSLLNLGELKLCQMLYRGQISREDIQHLPLRKRRVFLFVQAACIMYYTIGLAVASLAALACALIILTLPQQFYPQDLNTVYDIRQMTTGIFNLAAEQYFAVLNLTVLIIFTGFSFSRVARIIYDFKLSKEGKTLTLGRKFLANVIGFGTGYTCAWVLSVGMLNSLGLPGDPTEMVNTAQVEVFTVCALLVSFELILIAMYTRIRFQSAERIPAKRH